MTQALIVIGAFWLDMGLLGARRMWANDVREWPLLIFTALMGPIGLIAELLHERWGK